MGNFYSAFYQFYLQLLGRVPLWIRECLLCVSLLCVTYAFLRWIMQVFKARRWLKLCDLLFTVVAVCSIAYYALPEIVQPLDIVHNIDFTGVIPVLEVTGK